MSASKQCEPCGVKVTEADHFLSVAHLSTLHNLITAATMSSTNIRVALKETASECKRVCNQLELLKPNGQQERHLLYFWTGFHGHEGLNLRQGACMLHPHGGNISHEDEVMNETTQIGSLHDEPCNLLYLSGAGGYAAMPHMNITSACTISVLVKFHSLPPSPSSSSSSSSSIGELVRLSCTMSNRRDAIILSASEAGFTLATYHETYEEEKITSNRESIKIDDWIHVIAQVEHSGRLRLWVNGVLEKTDFGFPTGIQTGLRPHNTIGRNVHGVVKDIRIWNVPLGPNEIKELEETIRDTYQ